MESKIKDFGFTVHDFAYTDAGPGLCSCSSENINRFAPRISKASGSTSNVPRDKSIPIRGQARIRGLHSQVMKLREEDQQLARDVLEGREMPSERLAIWHLTAHMRELFAKSSRPVIPSPLGMEGTRYAIPVWDSV